MPRPGPRRPLVNFRLAEDTIAAVDQRARDEGLLDGKGEPNRSEMLRRMVDYALTRMPPGHGND